MTGKLITMLKAKLLRTVFAVSFAPGEAGWKKDADGNLILDNGNPVYVTADGREMVTESGTIARLNGEAKTQRERAEAAEKAFEPFKGLDADKARKAVETVSKIDAKTLIDAGEVDRVRDEIGKTYTAQISERDNKIAELTGTVDTMNIDKAFSSSKFVADRVAVPLDMFQDRFAKNFKREEGKLVPYDATGSKIFSAKRAGEIADFDEAVEILVNAYPYKDSILKAPDAGGSGNNGNGGGRGNGRFISRGDFEKLTPAEQAATAAKAGTGEISITD